MSDPSNRDSTETCGTDPGYEADSEWGTEDSCTSGRVSYYSVIILLEIGCKLQFFKLNFRYSFITQYIFRCVKTKSQYIVYI